MSKHKNNSKRINDEKKKKKMGSLNESSDGRIRSGTACLARMFSLLPREKVGQDVPIRRRRKNKTKSVLIITRSYRNPFSTSQTHSSLTYEREIHDVETYFTLDYGCCFLSDALLKRHYVCDISIQSAPKNTEI